MFNTSSIPSLSDIAAVTNGNNDGFGGNNGWWVLIILFAIFGGWGNGGYGAGGVQENYVLTSDFSQLSRQISDAYGMTERKLDGISNGICSLGYDQLSQINGINSNVMQGVNTLQAAIQNCCCTTQQNIKDTQYAIATNANMIDRTLGDKFCQTNFNMQTNTRDIIDNGRSDTQAILAKLDSMETNRLREKLEAERDAKYALQGQLDRAQLRYDIVNDVRPCPQPAYITCNPFSTCSCNQGIGYYGTTIA